VRRRVEAGRQVVESGDWTVLEPLPELCQLLVWAPLPNQEGAIAEYSGGTSERGSWGWGTVASPLDYLEQAGGALRQLRLLESSSPLPCCQSEVVIELASDALVFRSPVHSPATGPSPDLADLRPTYPAREAGEWAVCDWNARALDPLDAAGVLLLSQGPGDQARVPSAYVLWRDVDGVPRGWEAFEDLADPASLVRALGSEFRYAARDEELLVVDSSPAAPIGRHRPITEELLTTRAFARPQLSRPGDS
jgi:hypothetical protein